MEQYNVVCRGNNWCIEHNAETEGNYSTKEAAFEAIAFAASNAIKNGLGVSISVPQRVNGEDALGAERQRP
jgi:hypothetical protein